MIKKLVIPAAGLGSRLLPITKEMPKEMMPIFLKANDQIIVKPLIHALFEKFFQLGIREYCIIVGKQKRAIEDHFTINYDLIYNLGVKDHIRKDIEKFYTKLQNSKIFWVNQQKQDGFGDAVLHAESFVGSDEFLVSAGDTLIPNNDRLLRELMSMRLCGKNDAIIVLKEVPDPKRFGVAVVNQKGDKLIVRNVEEKPKRPKSNLAMIALYRFKPSIFSALNEIKRGKNELQLTDAIQKLIERKGNVHAIMLNKVDQVIDVGTAESYLETFKL